MSSETSNCIATESRMVVADRCSWENLILIIINMVYKCKKIYCWPWHVMSVVKLALQLQIFIRRDNPNQLCEHLITRCVFIMILYQKYEGYVVGKCKFPVKLYQIFISYVTLLTPSC
jgi:hypothetical protein